MDQLRLRIHTPGGVHKYDRSTSFSDLETFSVAGDGNCLEATFRALASGLGVSARDIVDIEVAYYEGEWQGLYRGMAVTPGAFRSPDLSEFKLVGLKKRFFELPCLGYSYPGGVDVSDQVQAILEYVDENGDGNVPAGVLVAPGTRQPLLGFSASEIKPNLNKVGEVFDQLAAQLPGFTVAPGSTYTYDGVTYHPGDTVPPVSWGVNYYGGFFFARRAFRMTLSETDPNTKLEWVEVDAEKLVTAVRFFFEMTTEEGMIEPLRTGRELPKSYVAAHPKASTLGRAEEVVPIVGDGAVLEIVPVPWTLAKGDLVSGNLGNLLDPYATEKTVVRTSFLIGPNENAPEPGAGGAIVVGEPEPGGGEPVATTLRTVSLANLQATIPAGQKVDGFVVERDNSVPTTWGFTLQGSVIDLGDDLSVVYKDAIEINGKVYVETAENVDGLDFNILFVSDVAAQDIGIRNLYLFSLNRPLLEKFAEAYFDIPADDPAEVSRTGWPVLLPAPYADLTLTDGSTLAKVVKAVEYSATRSGGLKAEVKIEQRSAAGATALKDIIKDQTTAAIRAQSLSLLGDHYVSQYRLPAQLSTLGVPLEQFKRRIKVNSRGATYFAEVTFAPGPPNEGATGGNEVSVMFGSSWRLVLWNDHVLELHFWTGAGWEARNPLLHPLFGEGILLPNDARHVTFCFDQSARLIVAYESNATIHLTRWDTVTNAYIQNVEAAGVDPLLFCDACVMFTVPGSDVTLFYLSSDRQTLLHRQQSDIYGVVYTDKVLGDAVSLDQLVPGNYSAQIYIGDEAGGGLGVPLTVALYPVYAAERFAVSGSGRDGDYAPVVFRADPVELLTVQGVALSGIYELDYVPPTEITGSEGFVVVGAALAGSYTPVLIAYAGKDAFAATGLALNGAYTLAVIRHAATETFTVSGSALDGSYTL